MNWCLPDGEDGAGPDHIHHGDLEFLESVGHITTPHYITWST